jgi:transposase
MVFCEAWAFARGGRDGRGSWGDGNRDTENEFHHYLLYLPPLCPHFAPAPKRLQSHAVAGFVGLPPLPPVENVSKVCALAKLRFMRGFHAARRLWRLLCSGVTFAPVFWPSR